MEPMSTQQASVRQIQLEQVLERAATEIGDITPQVLELYYSRYPQAREQFVELSAGAAESLEARMVEEALYCLMIWHERPLDVKTLLAEMVPHHEYLKVPVDYFTGLQAAVLDVLDTVVLENETDFKVLITALKSELIDAIERSAERRNS